MARTRNLAILVFDDVEVLDFCGPFAVISVTNHFTEPAAFKVFTVKRSSRETRATASRSRRRPPVSWGSRSRTATRIWSGAVPAGMVSSFLAREPAQVHLLPFGSGSQVCTGTTFALIDTAKHDRWQPAPGQVANETFVRLEKAVNKLRVGRLRYDPGCPALDLETNTVVEEHLEDCQRRIEP